MVPISNLIAPFVNKAGRLIQPWQAFLQQFVQAPPPFLTIIVGTSVFVYQAVEPGNVGIAGGTVSAVLLTRGSSSISLGGGTNRLIPVSINDTVTVTYSVKPNMIFIASYGNRTG